MKATEVTAGLAEINGSLLPGLWQDSLHVTCGLTACTPGSAPGPTLGNEYGKTLPFYNVAACGRSGGKTGLHRGGGSACATAATAQHTPTRTRRKTHLSDGRGRLSSHRHTRHNKRVVSVSCLAWPTFGSRTAKDQIRSGVAV